ncbi:MAG TPA: response regulator [Verrucomicrobiae bacterium]|nr:response regulator [Verrucomicrobiae bacterium]
MKSFLLAITNGLLFPAEWTNAVLILALMSICMVLALFAYLNYRTRKPYFNLWIVAWIFYAVYLAAALGLQESPNVPFLVMMRRSCIGLSALFMFWGSFYLTGQPRSLRELKFGTVMIVIWSAVAAFMVRDRFWITMPVFALLAAAGIYTGLAYFLRRKTYHGASILSFGFSLWGVHLLAFPYMEGSQVLMALGYLATAILTIMIVIGMTIEREVSAAEQTYRVLFDSASDAIFLVDLFRKRILEANAAALRLTKRSAIELVGRPFVEICPSLQGPETVSLSSDTIKIFNAVFRPFNEFPLARADGTKINCEGDTALVQWHQRPVLQVNVRDVSERQKAGNQLRRAEKLSALGQLIAGVAHELNNPLAVVTGYSQVLARKGNLDKKIRENLQRILHESERASKIVRDLLAFARPSDPQKTAMNINRLVAQVLEDQQANLQAAGIQLETQLAKDLPETMADHGQIEQVLVNLIGNAIYALSARRQPRVLTIASEETGNYIRIGVSDNGDGLPKDIVGKIFDPFFTTKPLGKGTGLGLTISNTIVQEHRGKILAENRLTGGARFTVELPVIPCATRAMEAEKTTETGSATSAPLKGSVLVVDDEPGIVEVLSEVLSGLGHKVVAATNGEEAMERIAVGSFDVILSDMRMPGMDGVKFFESLKQANKTLAHRIVFVTGDTVSPETRAFLESTGNRWVTKPFNIQQIIDTVDDMLDEQAVAA